MKNSLDADDILLNITTGPHNPVLQSEAEKVSEQDHKLRRKLTRALVVFKAYERTNPTKAASTPVVISATNDKTETTKMMDVPTNSNLTANQRLIEMLGK